MKTSSNKQSTVIAFLAALVFAAAQSIGQGIIGGNQNGLGPGGYLPKPPGSVNSGPGRPPAHFHGSSITTSLEVPGYDFQLVEISGQPVQVVIDSQNPVVVPLAAAAKTPSAVSPKAPILLGPPVRPPGGKNEPPVAAPQGPGFLATFELENRSQYHRMFEFVDQYYADIKIIFSVQDSEGTTIWQSYQIQVDIPPLAPKVDLVLGAHQTWRKTVFVPLYNPYDPTRKLLDPGQYTLQAQVIGTPGYLASAPFQVSTLVGGPIIPILGKASKAK